MKKKIVRWLSRDSDGLYMTWETKPQWRLKHKQYTGTNYISGSASSRPEIDINLKRGGLAKVTIERQY